MVDAPGVDVGADPGGPHGVGDLLAQLREAGCGVVDVEEALGEAEEVVDGARAAHGGHGRGVDVPVRRDDEDRPRAGDGLAERAPGAGVAVVVEGVHRVAVAEERGGHGTGGRGGHDR